MITIAGQTFEAFYCSCCGAKDSSKESMAKHEAYHAQMTEWCKGLTTYSRETAGYLTEWQKPKKKCLDCDRMAQAKGRCQRCYARDEKKKRERRKASKSVTIAAMLSAFIQCVMGTV